MCMDDVHTAIPANLVNHLGHSVARDCYDLCAAKRTTHLRRISADHSDLVASLSLGDRESGDVPLDTREAIGTECVENSHRRDAPSAPSQANRSRYLVATVCQSWDAARHRACVWMSGVCASRAASSDRPFLTPWTLRSTTRETASFLSISGIEPTGVASTWRPLARASSTTSGLAS